jgi:hypothetical protein
MFPSPKGKFWWSSNFNRNVLQRAYLAAGWRDADGNGTWTWHSLRHVFCTTALFTWKLEATDVSCMAGHANVRTTLLMYVGTTAGVLERAREATELSACVTRAEIIPCTRAPSLAVGSVRVLRIVRADGLVGVQLKAKPGRVDHIQCPAKMSLARAGVLDPELGQSVVPQH